MQVTIKPLRCKRLFVRPFLDCTNQPVGGRKIVGVINDDEALSIRSEIQSAVGTDYP